MPARYGPFSRVAGRPMTTPATAATAAAAANSRRKLVPVWVMNSPSVYAPTAMKPPWPSEIWPLAPVSKLRPASTTT